MPKRTIEKTRSRGLPRVCRNAAQIILNIKNYCKKELDRGRRISLHHVTERVMAATGLSRPIVCQFTTQQDVDEYDPAKDTRLRDMIVPTEFTPVIRHSIRYLIVEKKTNPTLNKILEILENGQFSEGMIWNYSRASLHRFMRKNDFVFGPPKSHYEYTRERAEIITMREKYLFWIHKYRNEGYHIFYQDETWLNKNMSPNRIWTYANNDVTDYKVPSGKGERSIICHLGSAETGLLDGCLLMFRGSKSSQSSDYHTEMNSEVFLDWLEKTVFPKLKQIGKKCVLVLDRATYHTPLTPNTRPPSTSWNKKDLAAAITRWGGPHRSWPMDWRVSRKVTKSIMMEHAKKIAPAPKYMVQHVADTFSEDDFSIKILFLPVAHPELNPIEMVWGHVKTEVAKSNFDFKLAALEEYALLQMDKFGPELFSRYCQHAMKQEDKYWEMADVLDLTAYDSAPKPPASDTETSSSAQESAPSENNQNTSSESSTSTD